MSNNRLLNFCLLVSLFSHVFIISLIRFSKQSSVLSAIPVEYITINKISLPQNITAPPTKPYNIATSISPQFETQKISTPYFLPEVKKINYVRGGDTTQNNPVIPLLSTVKQVNFNVSFSDKQHDKVVPAFDNSGQDLTNMNRLLDEKEASTVKSVASTEPGWQNESREQLTVERGTTNSVDQYRTKLLERVRSVISYPGWARRRGIGGQVVLEVLIEKSGAVSDIQIFRSSGDFRLDEAAAASVASIDSFPALPHTMAVSQAKVFIPVNYNLH